MSRDLPDPLSGAEIWRFLRACEAPIALAVGSGLLIALWLRRGREAGAAAVSSRGTRSRRIGAAGEARVAGELKRIGLPALQNVILWGAGWSVELDHVVRVPSGIVVLETKTLGGTIAGELGAPVWTQRTAGGVEVGRLDNPVLQNQAHVRAVEGFLGDLREPICGYVVSAGRARFAPEIADAVVPVGDLSWGAVDFLCRAEPTRSRCGVAAARARGGEERLSPRSARGVCAPPTGGVPASSTGVIACAPGILRAPRGASAAPRFRAACGRRRAPAITLVLTRVSA